MDCDHDYKNVPLTEILSSHTTGRHEIALAECTKCGNVGYRIIEESNV